MTDNQIILAAEIDADLAEEAYFEAFETDLHPTELDLLATEAWLARTQHEDLLLAELYEA